MTITETLDQGTMASFAPDQLASLTSETLSAHNELNDALHTWYDEPSQAVLNQIIGKSHNFAAHVLPPAISEALNIRADIKDNEAVYHPPTTEDAILLGNAWDVTQDNTTLQALALTIDEIPPVAPEIKVQKVLMHEALESAAENDNETFTANYVKAAADKGVIDEDASIKPNVYMDMSPNSPTETELGSIAEPEYDERAERLVRPVGAAFLRATMLDGSTAIPAVYFRPE